MALWDKLGNSGNVEDRRGTETPLLPPGISGSVITLGIVLVLGLLGVRVDPALLQQVIDASGVATQTRQTGQQPTEYQGSDSYETFASTVVGSASQYWSNAVRAQGLTYSEPRLVLFRTATRSGCGIATTDMGPHYCPNDQTIYLDETFFDVLSAKLGGSNGDVAQAYVIAHEMGHHAQNVLGTMEKVQSSSGGLASTGEDSLSVKLELQADCYAGLWANSIRDRGVFESPDEIQEAMSAASAVGDDRIQANSTGYVNPETWTHGSAAQRVQWFTRGWETGVVSQCQLL
ncbi:neutral zinc metallopeptidase [Candidatus Saccharibacteria bacterium]|nr:neutral zinc metallopeptidase [Candidatus Saccharibacteria bacterium]